MPVLDTGIHYGGNLDCRIKSGNDEH